MHALNSKHCVLNPKPHMLLEVWSPLRDVRDHIKGP